jgi:hypothetical protein
MLHDWFHSSELKQNHFWEMEHEISSYLPDQAVSWNSQKTAIWNFEVHEEAWKVIKTTQKHLTGKI